MGFARLGGGACGAIIASMIHHGRDGNTPYQIGGPHPLRFELSGWPQAIPGIPSLSFQSSLLGRLTDEVKRNFSEGGGGLGSTMDVRNG
jgi:hypothetical protein